MIRKNRNLEELRARAKSRNIDINKVAEHPALLSYLATDAQDIKNQLFLLQSIGDSMDVRTSKYLTAENVLTNAPRLATRAVDAQRYRVAEAILDQVATGKYASMPAPISSIDLSSNDIYKPTNTINVDYKTNFKVSDKKGRILINETLSDKETIKLESPQAPLEYFIANSQELVNEIGEKSKALNSRRFDFVGGSKVYTPPNLYKPAIEGELNAIEYYNETGKTSVDISDSADVAGFLAYATNALQNGENVVDYSDPITGEIPYWAWPSPLDEEKPSFKGDASGSGGGGSGSMGNVREPAHIALYSGNVINEDNLEGLNCLESAVARLARQKSVPWLKPLESADGINVEEGVSAISAKYNVRIYDVFMNLIYNEKNAGASKTLSGMVYNNHIYRLNAKTAQAMQYHKIHTATCWERDVDDTPLTISRDTDDGHVWPLIDVAEGDEISAIMAGINGSSQVSFISKIPIWAVVEQMLKKGIHGVIRGNHLDYRPDMCDDFSYATYYGENGAVRIYSRNSYMMSCEQPEQYSGVRVCDINARRSCVVRSNNIAERCATPHTSILFDRLDELGIKMMLSETFVKNFPIHCSIWTTKRKYPMSLLEEKAVKLDINASHMTALTTMDFNAWLGCERWEEFAETSTSLPAGQYLINWDSLNNSNSEIAEIVRECGGSNTLPSYDQCLTQKMLDLGIIQLKDIRAYLRPNTTLKRPFLATLKRLNAIVGYGAEHDDDSEITPAQYHNRKSLANTFCGMLGRTERKLSHTVITKSADDAEFYKGQNGKFMVGSSFVRYDVSTTLNRGEYIITESVRAPMTQTYLPWYCQIRDYEISRLLDLCAMGSPIKTYCDSVVLIPSKTANISPRPYYMGGYKREKITKRDLVGGKTRAKKCGERPAPTHTVEIVKRESVHDNDPEYKTARQMVREAIAQRKSLLISAEAGHGKSHLLKSVVAENPEIEFKLCAPTGVASRNIGGQTLHSLFNMRRDGTLTRPFSFNPETVFIVDECFNIAPCFVPVLLKLVQRNTVIFAGDATQLQGISHTFAPVGFSDIRNICHAHVVLGYNHRLPNPADQQRRADIIDALQSMKLIPIRDALQEGGNINLNNTANRAICYLNRTRKAFNARVAGEVAQSLPSDKKFDFVETDKESYRHSITFGVGMPVIAFETDHEGGVINGEASVIHDITADSVRADGINPTVWVQVKYEDGIVKTFTREHFTKYHVVAYAMTLHKSQGKTFNFPYQILDIDYMRGIHGGIYTAITRANSLDLILN